MSEHRPITVLALASEFKGTALLEECKRQGCRVLLLTAQACASAPWPAGCIDERFDMPDLRRQPDVTYAVSYLARGRRIDRIVPLDDYDVEVAAALREHLRLPGMGDTLARHFRDKLAMRVRASQAGIRVPPFTAVFNNDEVAEFLARVPAPWLLKPRTLAGSEGIRRFEHSRDVLQALEMLGDRRSYHVLEQFVPGDVYHVDALTWDGEVVFALPSKYGTPPMAALQGRGIFSTRTLERDGDEGRALLEHNHRLIKAMGLPYGVTHTEFIRARADGTWYFLETAARVGGGAIDRVIEAATGVVMWREAARIELADLRGERYTLPAVVDGHGGFIACPCPPGRANLDVFSEPEVRVRTNTGEFTMVVVGALTRGRVEQLLWSFGERFARIRGSS